MDQQTDLRGLRTSLHRLQTLAGQVYADQQAQYSGPPCIFFISL